MSKEEKDIGAAVEGMAVNEEEKKVVLQADFGELYIKVNPHGQIMRPIRASITLFQKAGHIYKVSGAFAITASGYRHLNKVASISLLLPLTVIVDGHEQPNPYIERDKQTRGIQSVILRKIGIGYSPVGNITAIDKTLYYNPFIYFLQSIQAKMKKVVWRGGKATDEKIFPNAAMIGEASRKPEKSGSWVFFPIEPPLGIWANYEDEAITDCLDEHVQRQRFGDRIAQTIVDRNILKDHPAIGVSNVMTHGQEGAATASVWVYGYRHEMGFPQVKLLLDKLSGEKVEIKAEEIRRVEPEVEKDALEEAAAVEDADLEKGEEKDYLDEPEPGLFRGNK